MLNSRDEPGLVDLPIQALGLDVGRTAQLGAAEPWLTSDPAAAFEQLARTGAFSYDHMRTVLYAASSDMLERARINAETFFSGLIAFSQMLHTAAAPEVFGWLFRLEDAHDDEARALKIVYLLSARQQLGDAPIDTINATLAAQQPRMEMALSLLREAPELAPYFNPNTGAQTLAALDPEAFEAVKQRMLALLDAHPQWEAILSTADAESNNP
jgi:hypothetical protein